MAIDKKKKKKQQKKKEGKNGLECTKRMASTKSYIPYLFLILRTELWHKSSPQFLL